MPLANPRKASDSTMELGRGLQTAKDSNKKKRKERQEMTFQQFLSRDMFAPMI